MVKKIDKMNQMKKIVTITHVLRIDSNAKMDKNVSNLVRDVMVTKVVQMDQMKKIELKNVLRMSSNAKMDKCVYPDCSDGSDDCIVKSASNASCLCV